VETFFGNMNNPYNDERHAAHTVRKFETTIKQDECVWHRDRNDRHIKILSGDGWMFQRDNCIPHLLFQNDSLFIEKETYHRIYKVGNTPLIISIYE